MILDHIGISGTRFGGTKPQLDNIRQILTDLHTPLSVFHHGRCFGIDTQAHRMAVELDYMIHGHPGRTRWDNTDIDGSEFATLEAVKPPLARNVDIVSWSRILIIAPQTIHEQRRSGTWMTYRTARRADKHILLCLPDGQVRNLEP